MCTLSTGQTAEITDCMVIPLTVQGVGEKQSIDLREVLTACIPSGEELRHMKHLRGVKLFELKNKKVELLVGLDASFVFRPLENIYGPRGTPDAVKTVLGWTLFGPAPSVLRPNSKGVCSMHVACVDEDDDDLQIPQCVVCMKTFSNSTMKLASLKQHLANAHPSMMSKNRSFF